MRRFPICAVCLCLLAAGPIRADDGTGRPPPFIPTMLGNGRTVIFMDDGIPSSRGPYKIAEGDSPYPRDRIYAHYNYDLESDPFPPGTKQDYVGDLTILLKGALVSSSEAVLSTGLVVVAPTGETSRGFFFDDALPPDQRAVSEIHSTLLEPFLGYGRFWDRFFVHGFTSVMVPTDGDDVTVLFNDVGSGWRHGLSSGFVTELVPTFEVHVNTPVTQRDTFVDSVDLTAGTHVVFGNHSSLGLGVGRTVTTPTLFEVEALVSFNWRF